MHLTAYWDVPDTGLSGLPGQADSPLGGVFLRPVPVHVFNVVSADEQGRCALCRRGVRGFDAAYTFGFYEEGLRELIQLFKYGRVQTLAAPLGRLLARALPLEQSFDLIVPMPLHWRKRSAAGV